MLDFLTCALIFGVICNEGNLKERNVDIMVWVGNTTFRDNVYPYTMKKNNNNQIRICITRSCIMEKDANMVKWRCSSPDIHIQA